MSQPVGEPFYPALGEPFYPGEEFLDYCGLFSNTSDDTPYNSVAAAGGTAWTAGGELIAASYVVNQNWWTPRPVLAWGKWGFLVRGTGTLTVQGGVDETGSWGWWDNPGAWPWTSLGTLTVDSPTEYQTLFVTAPPEVADLDFPNRAQALLRVAISGSVEIDRIFLRIASADGYFQKTGSGKFSQWYPAWDLPIIMDEPGYAQTYGLSLGRGVIWDETGQAIESAYPPAPSLVQGTAEEMQNQSVWGVPKDGPTDGYTYQTGQGTSRTPTTASFNDEYTDALGVLYPPTYTVIIREGQFAVYFINWASANSFPDPDVWVPIRDSGEFGIHWDAIPGTNSIFEYEADQIKMTLLGWTTYGGVFRSDPVQDIAPTTNTLVVAEGSTTPYFEGYVTSLHIVIVEGWTDGALSPAPGDGTTVATFDYGSPGVYQQGAPITLPGTTERFAVLAWARFGTWTLSSNFYPLWRSPAWRYWMPEWVLLDAGEIPPEEAWPFWIKVRSGDGIENWHPIGTEDLSKLPGRFKMYGPGGWWKEYMPGDSFGVRRPMKLLVAEGVWVTVARMIPD